MVIVIVTRMGMGRHIAHMRMDDRHVSHVSHVAHMDFAHVIMIMIVFMIVIVIVIMVMLMVSKAT